MEVCSAAKLLQVEEQKPADVTVQHSACPFVLYRGYVMSPKQVMYAWAEALSSGLAPVDIGHSLRICLQEQSEPVFRPNALPLVCPIQRRVSATPHS